MQTELITRTFLAIALFYIFAKVLGPLITSFFLDKMSGNKKKHNVDLDVLIERKKMMLKNGMPSASPTEVAKTDKKYSSKFEEVYSKEYETVSKQEKSDKRDKKLKSLKSILKLLDNLQWGEGEVFKSISEELKADGLNLNQVEVSAAIKDLISTKAYLSLHRPELPTFNEIKLATKTYLFMKNLIESVNTDHEKLHSFAKQVELTSKAAKKAFLIQLYIEQGKNKDEALEKVFIEKELIIKETESFCLNYLVDKKNKTFRSQIEFTEKVKEHSFIIKAITPLPELKKDDSEAAYKVLGLKSNTDIEEVKKKYKKLAIQLHPDKIHSLKLNEKLEKIAAANFTKIKEAYDIILANNQ